jgi:predicted secreted protein
VLDNELHFNYLCLLLVMAVCLTLHLVESTLVICGVYFAIYIKRGQHLERIPQIISDIYMNYDNQSG